MADPVQDGTTMNRLIHRAVLRDLRRFDVALQQYTDGDRERATALAGLFDRFDATLTHHHEGEDRHLWPVLSGTPEDTAEVGQLAHEHERIVAALGQAREAMARLRSTATKADADGARAAVVDLQGAAETHFQHEEREMQRLCAAAEPALLGATLRKLGKGQGFAEGMWFLQWIVDDATAEERAFLRRLIPPPAHWLSRRVAGRKYATATAAANAG